MSYNYDYSTICNMVFHGNLEDFKKIDRKTDEDLRYCLYWCMRGTFNKDIIELLIFEDNIENDLSKNEGSIYYKIDQERYDYVKNRFELRELNERLHKMPEKETKIKRMKI